MEVIDIINKIANEEDLPEKIKFGGRIYTFHKVDKAYYTGENNLLEILGAYKGSILNSDVEIIEDKKIEKIYYADLYTQDIHSLNDHINEHFNEVYNKIYELIDEVNKLKEDQC